MWLHNRLQEALVRASRILKPSVLMSIISILGAIVLVFPVYNQVSASAVETASAATAPVNSKPCVKPALLPNKKIPKTVTGKCNLRVKPRKCFPNTTCFSTLPNAPKAENVVTLVTPAMLLATPATYALIPLIQTTGTVSLPANTTNWFRFQSVISRLLNRNSKPNIDNCPECFGEGFIQNWRITRLGKPEGTGRYAWKTQRISREADVLCKTCGGSGKKYYVKSTVVGTMITKPENTVVFQCQTTRLILSRKSTIPIGTDTCAFDANASTGKIPAEKVMIDPRVV